MGGERWKINNTGNLVRFEQEPCHENVNDKQVIPRWKVVQKLTERGIVESNF